MLPASKHGDPQMGIDIHLCTVPPGVPAPLPTPHTSVVFDPFDYVPFLGATVTVCGMKRATAGTSATAIHIPPGFPFVPKLPDTDDELFMGSSTVVADGDPFSYVAVPVLGCQVAGMPSPPRPKKKGPPKAMLLPTSVNIAIPSTVVVGGAPTISLMGMAFKGLFSALGKFAKSGLFRRMRQRLFNNLNPGFLKCTILRAEPVNILNGSVSVEQQDFILPGRIPIEWNRTYSSSNHRKGLCGYGWETIVDIRLEVDKTNGSVSLIHPSIGPLFFERLPTSQGSETAELELMDGALLSNQGNEYHVRTKEDRIYRFQKSLVHTNLEGDIEYPISGIDDLCNNSLQFEYNNNKLIAINESAGRRINLLVKNGCLIEVSLTVPGIESHHTFVRYHYDQYGDLVSVVDALEKPYTFAYDNHHMVRHTDRNNLSFYYEFDKSKEDEWRVVHAWGDGNLYNYYFEYFDVLNERRITDSLGHVSIVNLNESGLPISEIDPLGGMTNFEYDDSGRTTAVTDPDQHCTQYEYDDRGNLLKLTRPDGVSIESEFNANNKAANITDPNGATWLQEWNEQGLLVRQLSPLEAETFYKYDIHGQLVEFINPLGTSTKLHFDALGNLGRLTDALGHATAFSYDIIGDVITKVDPLGNRTAYKYDRKGRLRQATLPGGSSIACAYDNEENLIHYVDENGAETKLEYFGVGEIKRRIQPDGHTVEYHYDTEERLTGVTNQRGELYQLIRDPLGRIVEEIDYWGQARRYEYSASGYLQKSTDPLDQVVHFETDPLGRIIKKHLPDLRDTNAVLTEIFEYDANGNLVACENSAIKIERSFDLEGRLLEEEQGDTGLITNSYDLNGNRTSREIKVEFGERQYANKIHFQYDILDQSIGVEAKSHDPLQFTRNAVGQVTKENLGSSINRDFTYNSDGYLTAQSVQTTEGPLFDQSYRYDRIGNLIEKRDSSFGVDQFNYDPIGRITAHLNPDGKVKRYLNDPAGDRLSTRTTFQSESDNGETEWRRDGEYDGTYYRFDRVGNLVERHTLETDTQFSWDASQRLVESVSDDRSTVYQYDSLGRRVCKETDGIATHFFWDGDALLGDLLVDEANIDKIASSRLREWVYYPDSFEPLVMFRNSGELESEFYLYHNDPNGCPTRLLDAAGYVVWAAQYDACGGVERVLVDQLDNPIRLQGQYEDGESGLYYNRYRNYLSNIAQYISIDPLKLLVGENLYKYGYNSLGWIDPLGLECALVRRGTSKESATRLQRQADAAEKAGFPHGVSVTTPESNLRLSRNPADASHTTREALENSGFPVHPTPTRNDPFHHTVELPAEVTPEVARRFNEVLGRN